MLATSGSQRSFGLAALALLLLFGLIGLLKAFPSTTQNGLNVIGRIKGYHGFNSTEPIRIKKATALVGQPNHVFEMALKTHERHNAVHGYEMQVLRERLAGNFFAKPSFLLSLIIEEIGKAAEERAHWVAWFDSDTIILNPQVPLEMFLPPEDMTDINLVVTHDDRGLNSGAMFLRVNSWTIRLLIEVLAVPLRDTNRPEIAVSKDQPALELVLANRDFAGHTVYQPRPWFNAFHINGHFEGQRGTLLAHFPDVGGEKWTAMEEYLANVTMWRNPWDMRLSETWYEGMLGDYWGRIRQAKELLEDAKPRQRKELLVLEAADNLRFALDYRSDEYPVLIEALIGLKKALKDRQSE